MAKIKICGLKTVKDIEYINIAKVDYAGFILSKGYKRSIDKQTLTILIDKLNKGIIPVGVFVNEDINTVNDFLNSGLIKIAQLHGSETPSYCNKVNGKVIKYFNCNEDIQSRIKNYNTDYFLFDSGKGSGKTFDWNNIPQTDKKFFVAGGINENNISKLINTINPYGVDLSSSVETNGHKDLEKIKKIMEAVK